MFKDKKFNKLLTSGINWNVNILMCNRLVPDVGGVIGRPKNDVTESGKADAFT